MKTFNEKIKSLRKEKNLTQKELAEALSVTISTLSHWECAYQEPSFEYIVALANFFNCTTDYLLGREPDIEDSIFSQKEKSPTVELTAEEKELLDNYRQLPKDLKHRAEAYMEKLVEVLNEEDVRPISAPSNPSSQTPRSTLRITRRR